MCVIPKLAPLPSGANRAQRDMAYLLYADQLRQANPMHREFIDRQIMKRLRQQTQGKRK